MVIIGLLLTCIFGFLIVRAVTLKIDAITTLLLSYLVGLGLQTLFMFYMAVLYIKLTSLSVVIVLVSAIAILGIVQAMRKDKFWLFPGILIKELIVLLNSFKNRANTAEKIIAIVILGIFIYVIVFSIYWPVVGWDSIALYDFRAKVFSSTGYMDDAIRRGYFFGYPLMTSMAHTWIYLLGFHYPKFLYSLMYISLSVLFFKFIRSGLTRWAALLLTFIMMFSSPLFSHATFDYTNLPYAVYFFLSQIFLVKWFKARSRSYIILSALLMGIAVWIRSTDPFWVVNIAAIIVAVAFMKRSIKDLIIYLAIFIPIQQGWNIFLTYMSPNVSSQALLAGSVSALSKGIDFVKMVKVFDFISRAAGPVLTIYIFIAAVSFYFAHKQFRKNIFLYLLLMGNFGVLLLGAYLFSFIYPGWGAIGESLGRMVFVFIPLLVYVTAINLNGFIEMQRNNEKQKNL